MFLFILNLKFFFSLFMHLFTVLVYAKGCIIFMSMGVRVERGRLEILWGGGRGKHIFSKPQKARSRSFSEFQVIKVLQFSVKQ